MTRKKAELALIDELRGRTIVAWTIALALLMTICSEFEHIVELLS